MSKPLRKEQSFNIRVVKGEDGVFRFDDKCSMDRRVDNIRFPYWKEASKTDRMRFRTQLQYGG